MTDKIYTAQQIKSILQPIFTDYNVKKAILFGSYAKGMANSSSDVDILVDSGLKGLSFFGLIEDITSSLDKNVDLIDVSQVKQNSQVECEIMNSGVMIYG